MNEFQSEDADIARCQSVYGPPMTHCAGGRMIVQGYVCPHCSSPNPRGECFSPNLATILAEMEAQAKRLLDDVQKMAKRIIKDKGSTP